MPIALAVVRGLIQVEIGNCNFGALLCIALTNRAADPSGAAGTAPPWSDAVPDSGMIGKSGDPRHFELIRATGRSNLLWRATGCCDT